MPARAHSDTPKRRDMLTILTRGFVARRLVSTSSERSVDASLTEINSYSTGSAANIVASREMSIGRFSASLRKEKTTETSGRAGVGTDAGMILDSLRLKIRSSRGTLTGALDASLAALIALQALDTTADTARKRLAEMPGAEQAIQARISEATAAADAIKSQIADNQKASRDLERDVAGVD